MILRISPLGFGLLLLLTLFSAARAESQPALNPLAGVAVTELARREIWQDGRRLSYVHIRPPVLPQRPPPPPAPVVELPPEELAIEERRATKAYCNITLMGGVYVGDATIPSGTELRLLHREGEKLRQARVYVPVDLRQVDNCVILETSDTVYVYAVHVAVAELATLSKSEWPAEVATYAAARAEANAAPAPDYIFEGTADDAAVFEETLRGLEVLLAHIALNRDALAAAYAAREAANAERARVAALQPPPSRDQTIYFWKIETPAAR